MHSDRDLRELASRVGVKLATAKLRLVTAESCTGGWIAKALTDVPGSSGWFDGGFVTYANSAKVRDLGVLSATLDTQGAVSEPVVREMANGALRVTGAEVAISVSGVAGPEGGTPSKPVGLVWFGLARHLDTHTAMQMFAGDREAIRREAVAFALRLVLDAR